MSGLRIVLVKSLEYAARARFRIEPNTPTLHVTYIIERSFNDLNCLNEFIRVALWRTEIISF